MVWEACKEAQTPCHVPGAGFQQASEDVMSVISIAVVGKLRFQEIRMTLMSLRS